MSFRKRKDIKHSANLDIFFGKIRVVLKMILAIVRPIVQDAANRVIVEEGIPLAQGIVNDLMNQDIPSSKKREMAQERLDEALKDSRALAQAGVAQVSTSLLNWLIETAVQSAKTIAAKENA